MQLHEIKSDLAVSTFDIINASRVAVEHSIHCAFTDSPHRAHMRLLLEGAGFTGAEVRVAFLKGDGSLRYMRCLPTPGADGTARYVTVQDLDLSEESGRTVHRRVCLDSVAGITVRFRPM